MSCNVPSYQSIFLSGETIPPLLLQSLMMVFSVAISLHSPLKEPAFCRIVKKPALKRDSTFEGRLGMSKRYIGVHLE